MSFDSSACVAEMMEEILYLLRENNLDSDVFLPFLSYFASLKTVEQTNEFKKAQDVNYDTSMEEAQWVLDLYYKKYGRDFSFQYLMTWCSSESAVKRYIGEVVTNTGIGEREKIVILLAHFESFLFAKFKEIPCLTLDKGKLETSLGNIQFDFDNYELAYVLAVIKIVYANTKKGEFDKRLPHRNDILHNGITEYSDDQIKQAYGLLLDYFAFLDFNFSKSDLP